jgi:hypothetical protein
VARDPYSDKAVKTGKLENPECSVMSFVFGYLVSMRYLLLGYLRRCICVANRIAFRDPTQLVLLGISERTRTES